MVGVQKVLESSEFDQDDGRSQGDERERREEIVEMERRSRSESQEVECCCWRGGLRFRSEVWHGIGKEPKKRII